jgi:hypothetical protein
LPGNWHGGFGPGAAGKGPDRHLASGPPVLNVIKHGGGDNASNQWNTRYAVAAHPMRPTKSPQRLSLPCGVIGPGREHDYANPC